MSPEGSSNLAKNKTVLIYYTGGGDAKWKKSKSGKVYDFKQGVPTEVDEQDTEDMLAYTKKQGCCGSSERIERKLFELA